MTCSVLEKRMSENKAKQRFIFFELNDCITAKAVFDVNEIATV
jgi:hypothetical protein